MTNAIASTVDQALTRAAQWRRAFDARARRERILVIVATLSVAAVFVYLVGLEPALKQWSAARVRQAAAVAAVLRTNDELAQHASVAAQLQAEVAAWRERVAQGDKELRALRSTLVSAPEMVPVLDRLLTQVGSLHLRSMQSLGRTEVRLPGAATPAAEPQGAGALYRHGVDLVVEGSYADVHAYLRAVEAMPQRVLWGGLQLQVERHPKVVMALRLYTLSDDGSWLEI